MKNKAGFLLTAALALCLLCGCVSQEDYDTLLAERDSLQATVTQKEADIAELQAYAGELQEEIAAQTAALDEAEALVATQSESIEDLTALVEQLQTELKNNNPKVTIDQELIDSVVSTAEDVKNDATTFVTETAKGAWSKVTDFFEK